MLTLTITPAHLARARELSAHPPADVPFVARCPAALALAGALGLPPFSTKASSAALFGAGRAWVPGRDLADAIVGYWDPTPEWPDELPHTYDVTEVPR